MEKKLEKFAKLAPAGRRPCSHAWTSVSPALCLFLLFSCQKHKLYMHNCHDYCTVHLSTMHLSWLLYWTNVMIIVLFICLNYCTIDMSWLLYCTFVLIIVLYICLNYCTVQLSLLLYCTLVLIIVLYMCVNYCTVWFFLIRNFVHTNIHLYKFRISIYSCFVIC